MISKLFFYQDVIRAISEAIQVIKNGKHDPFQAHERIKTFYNWEDVAIRTERVYDAVLKTPQLGLMKRMERFVFPFPLLVPFFSKL